MLSWLRLSLFHCIVAGVCIVEVVVPCFVAPIVVGIVVCIVAGMVVGVCIVAVV